MKERVKTNREEYDSKQEEYQKLKEEVKNAQTADELMELATKLKALENEREEIIGSAQELAKGDNAVFDQEKAAKENEEHEELKARDAAKNAAEIETINKEIKAMSLLENLSEKGMKFDPFNGRVSPEIQKEGKELAELLSETDQEALAQQFFNNTIGRNGTYNVYALLKGTKFAEKFRELEDQRLKKAGHDGFNL